MAFLTMRSLRQPVATDGNGFRLLWGVQSRSDLPLIAIGCNHGLHKGSTLCSLARQQKPLAQAAGGSFLALVREVIN